MWQLLPSRAVKSVHSLVVWPSTCVAAVAVPHRKCGGNFKTFAAPDDGAAPVASEAVNCAGVFKAMLSVLTQVDAVGNFHNPHAPRKSALFPLEKRRGRIQVF